MEYFLHFITADIKYNFWCEEDGHQFREDWVKCRLNIKYVDSPNIQISCYPCNPYETIPLNVGIDFADFRFEKVVEMHGTKTNVFALLWTQHNQTSEFYIAIDNEIQYKNYESYLNNMLKICRIAETERLDAQTAELSSISYQNVGDSSLSLFSTSVLRPMSTYDMDADITASTESIVKKDNGKHRFGFSHVKNATKCAAKKFNRILSKAKSKIIKPSPHPHSPDVSISSSCTQITDIDLLHENDDEFKEIDLNEVSSLSLRTTMYMEDWDRQDANEEPNDSFNPSATTISCFDLDTSPLCVKGTSLNSSINSISSTGSSSSVNSSLMHQIFAESIADLNIICSRNETFIVKPSGVKKLTRIGTPYKLKMPQQLTMFDEIPASERKNDSNEEKMASYKNDAYDFCVDAFDLPVYDPNNGSNVYPDTKTYFIQKETFGKRVARTMRDLWQHVLKTQATINESHVRVNFNYHVI